MLQAAELEGRMNAWGMSEEQSVSGRDRVADFNVLPNKVEIINLKGEIKALEEERDYLQLLLSLPKQ